MFLQALPEVLGMQRWARQAGSCPHGTYILEGGQIKAPDKFRPPVRHAACQMDTGPGPEGQEHLPLLVRWRRRSGCPRGREPAGYKELMWERAQE